MARICEKLAAHLVERVDGLGDLVEFVDIRQNVRIAFVERKFLEFPGVDRMQLTFEFVDVDHHRFVVISVYEIHRQRDRDDQYDARRDHRRQRVLRRRTRRRDPEHDLAVAGRIDQTRVIVHIAAVGVGSPFGKALSICQRVLHLGSVDVVFAAVPRTAVRDHRAVFGDKSDAHIRRAFVGVFDQVVDIRSSEAGVFDKVRDRNQPVVDCLARQRDRDRDRRHGEHRKRRRRNNEEPQRMLAHVKPRT